MTRTPVIVVTGFLGSGKTTLLNRVLRRRAARAAGGTIAMIVNELGLVGIDGDLLAGGPRQVELPGGCVCCVLGDALDRTVVDLIATNPDLDAIVLETTGVAEPLPIMWAFERAPLATVARLAVVVTLVDATAFASSRPLSPAVDEQVRHADVIIVTKGELVPDAERTAVLQLVSQLAPQAPVVEGDVDVAATWLEDAIADVDLQPRRVPAVEEIGHGHGHGHGDLHGIDSVWIPIPELLDLEELEDQLAALPGNYVRIKGIARAVDGRVGEAGARLPRWVAFHRVGLRVSSEPLARPSSGRVVALGRGVERAPLAACIAAAVITSMDDGRDR
jgi:G3E family GTPase